MSREFFSTLVRMEFRSHDFDDESKRAFYFHLLSHIQSLSFLIRFQVFCTAAIFGTLCTNLE